LLVEAWAHGWAPLWAKALLWALARARKLVVGLEKGLVHVLEDVWARLWRSVRMR